MAMGTRDWTGTWRATARFGLGASEYDRRAAAPDPYAWVIDQIGRPAPGGAPILPAMEAMRVAETGERAFREARRAEAASGSAGGMTGTMAGSMAGGSMMSTMTGGAPPKRRQIIREAASLARRKALRAAADSRDPFAERWVAHWTNHFTVRGRNSVGRLLVPPHRAEAIEPHAWGRFADMLLAAALHPAMLHDLDARFSVGPNSPVGRKRHAGLNENLAREMLELHTLGADGGYGQDDVSALALALTGWQLPSVLKRDGTPRGPGGRVRFHARGHEPGPRTILGTRFAEDDGTGSQSRAVLAHLAAHPSTARNVGRRLAAHFHSPGPGRAALAAALADAFGASGGDMRALARALASHDAPWTDRPVLTTPREQVTAWMRLAPGLVPATWSDRAARLLGQAVHTAPSPEGWPEGDEWASPGGLKSRLDLANEWGTRGGNRLDPPDLARDALGDGLSDETMTALRRAASPAQGLAILAMAPEVILR